jgi:hypothetical protein
MVDGNLSKSAGGGGWAYRGDSAGIAGRECHLRDERTGQRAPQIIHAHRLNANAVTRRANRRPVCAVSGQHNINKWPVANRAGVVIECDGKVEVFANE